MVGSALDDHVVRLQQCLALVEDQRHLARNDDPVVDRLGAMHERMRRLGLHGGGVGVADLGEGVLHAFRAVTKEIIGVWRDVDEAEARAVARRRQAERADRRLGCSPPERGSPPCSRPRGRPSPAARRARRRSAAVRRRR